MVNPILISIPPLSLLSTEVKDLVLATLPLFPSSFHPYLTYIAIHRSFLQKQTSSKNKTFHQTFLYLPETATTKSENNMDLFSSWPCYVIFTLVVFLTSRDVSGATFTFVNKCDYTVWPGTLSNAGTPKLESTGFELQKGSSRVLEAPAGWSGRFWGRTGCNFDTSGQGSCKTGDCGSNQMECNGAGAAPPATLAEFTLGSGAQDFYDVSLVDGYNLPMVVDGTGGLGTCVSTGCVTDINRQCPRELRFGDGDACKSACEAFGTPEYCCSGAYNTPATCKPSVYAAMFKSACPRSYSYAYDDATSTFTCTGADYTITFCPSYSNSQKSSTTDSTPQTTGTTGGSGSTSSSGSVPGSRSGPQGMLLADGSWVAGLAAGDATRTITPAFQTTFMGVVLIVLALTFLYL